MPPTPGEFRLAAVSLVGLAVFTATGCLWLSFDQPKLNPCHDVRMIDGPSLQRSPDEATVWAWLPREHIDGQTYVGHVGDTERVAAEIRRYRLSHPGTTAGDYFRSLGMSCQPHDAGLACHRRLVAHYVCVRPEPPDGATAALRRRADGDGASRSDRQHTDRLGYRWQERSTLAANRTTVALMTTAQELEMTLEPGDLKPIIWYILPMKSEKRVQRRRLRRLPTMPVGKK